MGFMEKLHDHPEFTTRYDDVVDMDPRVEVFRDKYVEDLSRRLEVNANRLPPASSIHEDFNPQSDVWTEASNCRIHADDRSAVQLCT